MKHTHLMLARPFFHAASLFHQLRNPIEKVHEKYYTKNISPEPLVTQESGSAEVDVSHVTVAKDSSLWSHLQKSLL